MLQQTLPDTITFKARGGDRALASHLIPFFLVSPLCCGPTPQVRLLLLVPLSYAWFGVTVRDVLTSSLVYPESALPHWSAVVWVSCDSRILSLHRLLA